ncbi:MAG: hypothetical protein ACFFDW_08645 [Candidatus Thorarchaeota archaeon]
MNKGSRIFIQIGILLGFIGTVVVNALSALLPINGQTPGEISDNIPNLFVPAGLTFSVWSVIYIALLGLTIYSIKSWFKKDQEPSELLDKYGIEFIIAAIANITWIFLWHYNFVGLSTIAMVVLLGSLLSAYIRLRIGKGANTIAEKWFIHIPLSIYLGWITIATVANITATLVTFGWNGFGASESFWAILMIAIATVITLLMLILRNDIAYSLVVIWSLVGIILKRVDTTLPGYTPQLGIVITSSIGIGLVTLLIGFVIFKYFYKKRKTSKVEIAAVE